MLSVSNRTNVPQRILTIGAAMAVVGLREVPEVTEWSQ